MKLGNVLVDQVNENGQIVKDFDESLSIHEIFRVLKAHFPNLDESGISTVYHGVFQGHKYSVRIKNITYLGIPHPEFKKRIQISNDLHDFVNHSVSNGFIPLLLGIYSYKGNYIFCDFNIDDYIHKAAHNSSAHVSINDILQAVKFGFFQKTDMFNNNITTFNTNNVGNFLSSKFGVQPAENELLKMLNATDLFMSNLNSHWIGINAYQEMYTAQYSNWRQAEWCGFYFEFLFDNFITNHPQYTSVFHRHHGLTRGSFNLDLFFPGLNMYGDLKSHNHSNTSGIIANDKPTIDRILQASNETSIYFIIASGIAQRDRDFNNVTARYYSNLKGRTDLSYASRMKYDFLLQEYFVIDLSNQNYDYTGIFSQGRNSNGQPRPPKVLFPSRHLDNFIIHKERVVNE